MRTIEIGLPCSPSKLLSHEYVSAKKLTISWGGGMAGSSQTQFCTKIEPDDEIPGFLKLTLFTGEKMSVNPANIVKRNDVQIVKVVYDITDFVNYHKRLYKSSITTEFIELRFDEAYVIVDRYTARHTGVLEKRVIQKFSNDIAL